MSKHTPGPWNWHGNRDRLVASSGQVVIDSASYEGMWLATYNDEVDAANARLIAAAPELLEACRAIAVSGISHQDERIRYIEVQVDLEDWKTLHAAIAKAEGAE